MSDLKKMAGIASNKAVFFLYCEGDRQGAPYLMMAATAAELTPIKEVLKREAKKKNFAQGTVDGSSGQFVFAPKKPCTTLIRDVTKVFAKEVPALKSAVLSSAVQEDKSPSEESPKKKTKGTEKDEQEPKKKRDDRSHTIPVWLEIMWRCPRAIRESMWLPR